MPVGTPTLAPAPLTRTVTVCPPLLYVRSSCALVSPPWTLAMRIWPVAEKSVWSLNRKPRSRPWRAYQNAMIASRSAAL